MYFVDKSPSETQRDKTLIFHEWRLRGAGASAKDRHPAQSVAHVAALLVLQQTLDLLIPLPERRSGPVHDPSNPQIRIAFPAKLPNEELLLANQAIHKQLLHDAEIFLKNGGALRTDARRGAPLTCDRYDPSTDIIPDRPAGKKILLGEPLGMRAYRLRAGPVFVYPLHFDGREIMIGDLPMLHKRRAIGFLKVLLILVAPAYSHKI